ncbi:PKD domain containing protein [Methanosalsum zhilinae DSM 4017]|uniref:PKD domain containing protein n=1 Tax=Methanosalsum zhilinae (strain DSM 4017 / NBRC 107636 / OCM 62 / WeN5) TaxID=679901 RepID=F7XL86_METZD|nr:PKD domain-containing protein [Methanosalsum zhilinae]AEH60743.1 PKD domain containing protein [Methanosalsum zhilinae DSM 4017]
MKKIVIIMIILITLSGIGYAHGASDNTSVEGASEPKTVFIRMQQLAFIPSNVEINAGDTVRWQNLQTEPNRAFTLVSEDRLWQNTTLTYRRSLSYTFNESGTYHFYVREFPARMSGTVTVMPPAQKPLASFTATPASGEAPLEVTFIDESEYAVEYQWDFGDGTTSTQTSPTHTYEEVGTYTVTLTVTNEVGQDTLSKTITVETPSEMPFASFTATPTSGEVPLEVTFIDESENAVEYHWEFGDGETSTQANPSHTYTQPGMYNVTLTVTNEAGQDVSEVTITAEEPEPSPIPGFGVVTLIICLFVLTYMVRKDE